MRRRSRYPELPPDLAPLFVELDTVPGSDGGNGRLQPARAGTESPSPCRALGFFHVPFRFKTGARFTMQKTGSR